jgi:hypothetical protein
MPTLQTLPPVQTRGLSAHLSALPQRRRIRKFNGISSQREVPRLRLRSSWGFPLGSQWTEHPTARDRSCLNHGFGQFDRKDWPRLQSIHHADFFETYCQSAPIFSAVFG